MRGKHLYFGIVLFSVYNAMGSELSSVKCNDAFHLAGQLLFKKCSEMILK